MQPTTHPESPDETRWRAGLLAADPATASAIECQAAAEGLEFVATRVLDPGPGGEPADSNVFQGDRGGSLEEPPANTSTAPDALDALAAVPATRCLVACLGPGDVDREFLTRVGAVAADLPVIVYIAGENDSRETVGGHPVSAVRRAALQQVGALHADSLEEAVMLAVALAGLPLPTGDGVAVVSNAGGPGVLAADAIGAERLTLATLGNETHATLQTRITRSGSPRNPIDVVGDADLALFADALDAVLSDDAVGAAIVLSAPSTLFRFAELADTVVDVSRQHEEPVVTCFMGGGTVEQAADRLRAAGIPNFFDPARAARSLAGLAAYRDTHARTTAAAPPWPTESVAWAQRTDIPLDRDAGFALLDAAGVPTAPSAPDTGTTVHVEATRTPSLGPLVAVSVDEFEALVDDVAIRLAPISTAEAEHLLGDLRAAPLLDGARGHTPIETGPLADAIHRITTTFAALVPVNRLGVDLVGSPDGVRATTVRLARATDEDGARLPEPGGPPDSGGS